MAAAATAVNGPLMRTLGSHRRAASCLPASLSKEKTVVWQCSALCCVCERERLSLSLPIHK